MTDDDRGGGPSGGVGRRTFLKVTGGTAVLAAIPAAAFSCAKHETKAAPPAQAAPLAPVDASRVRVASVPTAVEGNLLPTLIADFERGGSVRVELTSSEDPYELARAGKVDLAISHYGHKHAEDFVMEGYGSWPRTVFSNQMALVGPPSDPARVRGLTDAAEAFRRIAEAKSLFMSNGIDGVRYLCEILWNAAGRPDRAGWYIDDGLRKDAAILAASARGAYAFWGLTPFVRLDRKSHLGLEPLVLGDPLLQRMLVSIVVSPAKVPGVNAAGASALEAHLLSPATQARIRDVRYPGADAVSWVPGGRHNRSAMLPKG